MCFRQGIGDLRRDGERLFQHQRFALDSRVERLTLDVLHGDEATSVFFADLVNGADVRMIQLGCCSRFSHKSLSCLLICHQTFGQELDRDFAIELRVLGQINLAHPARTKWRADFIATEFCAGGNSHFM